MEPIICAIVSAASAIIVAIITSKSAKAQKAMAEQAAKSEAREAQREQQQILQLEMQHANTSLTVGVAMALKHGHCNGEVEAGLAAVKAADEKYQRYLEGIAVHHLAK